MPDEGATGSVHFSSPASHAGAHILASCAGSLALVSSIIFVDALLFTALTPLVPGYADEFGLSKSGAGLLVAAFGAGALFGGDPGWARRRAVRPEARRRRRARPARRSELRLRRSRTARWRSALARFVQGISSTVTWAGALAWIAGAAPKEQRGEMIGIAFGAAIFGAILGPLFGGIAELAGIRGSFISVGVVALAFAGLAVARRARLHASRSPPRASVARSATAASSAASG